MGRYSAAFILAALLGPAGCQADREALDEGADLEAPPAVEEAPATPMPPQPMPPQGSPSDTTLPPLDPDTFGPENIRPPAD
ncbi:MAG: hypothetical protein WD737_07575 [Gemmatimonadota bacterium]